MESKDVIPLVCLYVYMFYLYIVLTVSSPYLLMCGDDRVCGASLGERFIRVLMI